MTKPCKHAQFQVEQLQLVGDMAIWSGVCVQCGQPVRGVDRMDSRGRVVKRVMNTTSDQAARP